MKRIAVLAFALIALSLAGHASAQTSFDVTQNEAQIHFPTGVNFTLAGTSPAAVTNVRLSYQVAPDYFRASVVPQCTFGTTFSCTYTLISNPANLLIPQAEITYSWAITAGDTTGGTPDQKITYDDTRHTWKTLSRDNMTIWYYSGSEDDAQAVLNAAYDSEQKSSALLQTTVDYPVKLIYYETAQEMAPAIQSDNDEGVVTLGEVVYSDTAMVAADSSPEDIARHEIAHVVQRAALTNAYNPPDWVVEGMAVFEQSEPLGGQRDAIQSAIESGNVLSVRSMSSASSGALSGNVFLFYGEAWSLVKYLIDTYGEAKFADYFHAIDAGAGDAGSLQQVYGFNQDGLENAWRDSVGLPPRSAATPDASNPDGNGDNVSSPSNTNSDSNTTLVVMIIAVTGAIAAFFLGFGVYLARRLG